LPPAEVLKHDGGTHRTKSRSLSWGLRERRLTQFWLLGFRQARLPGQEHRLDVQRAFTFVDAVHRALVDARLVLHIHARLRDHVRHGALHTRVDGLAPCSANTAPMLPPPRDPPASWPSGPGAKKLVQPPAPTQDNCTNRWLRILQIARNLSSFAAPYFPAYVIRANCGPRPDAVKGSSRHQSSAHPAPCGSSYPSCSATGNWPPNQLRH
jgi:hypothetical protein